MKGLFFLLAATYSFVLCQNKIDSLPKVIFPNNEFTSRTELLRKLDINYNLRLLSDHYFKEKFDNDFLLKMYFPDEPFDSLNENEYRSYLKNKSVLKTYLASFNKNDKYPQFTKLQEWLSISQHLTALLFAVIHLIRYK